MYVVHFLHTASGKRAHSKLSFHKNLLYSKLRARMQQEVQKPYGDSVFQTTISCLDKYYSKLPENSHYKKNNNNQA